MVLLILVQVCYASRSRLRAYGRPDVAEPQSRRPTAPGQDPTARCDPTWETPVPECPPAPWPPAGGASQAAWRLRRAKPTRVGRRWELCKQRAQ